MTIAYLAVYRVGVEVRIGIRSGVWLVSGYVYMFMLRSVVIVTLPNSNIILIRDDETRQGVDVTRK